MQPFTQPTPAELARFRFRYRDRLQAMPPRALLRMVVNRQLQAPVEEDFGTWATRHFGPEAAQIATGFVGVITYDADIAQLSAALVGAVPSRDPPRWPVVRYVTGGWGRVIDRMAAHARSLGVRIELGSRVDVVDSRPVIVATSLDAARILLGDDTLRWDSGRAVLLDLGLKADPKDVFVVSDLDEGGFLERYSMPDPSLAPPEHALVQAELPMRAGESQAQALSRLERLADLGLPGWRERVTWRREATANRRTGALDQPGFTWRDRPAIDRGAGVWLAGDSVAAPGLLSEVSIHSALAAANAAVGALWGMDQRRRSFRSHHPPTTR